MQIRSILLKYDNILLERKQILIKKNILMNDK